MASSKSSGVTADDGSPTSIITEFGNRIDELDLMSIGDFGNVDWVDISMAYKLELVDPIESIV